MAKIIIFLIIFYILPSSYAASIDASLYKGSSIELSKRYHDLLKKESGKSPASLIRKSMLSRLIDTLKPQSPVYPSKYIKKYKGKTDVKKLKNYINEIISAENQLNAGKKKFDYIELKSNQLASAIAAAKNSDNLLTNQLEYALLQRDKEIQKRLNNQLVEFIKMMDSEKSSILKNCNITKNRLELYKAKWNDYKPKDYTKQITKLELLKLKDENNLNFLSYKQPIQLSNSAAVERFPLQIDIKTIQVAILKWKLMYIKDATNHIDDGLNLLMAQICSKKPSFRDINNLYTTLIDMVNKLSKKDKKIIDNLLILRKSVADFGNKLNGNQRALKLLNNFGKAEATLSAQLVSVEGSINRDKSYLSHISDFITLKQGVVGAAIIRLQSSIKTVFASIIGFLVKPFFVYKNISLSLWSLLKIALIAIFGWISTVLAKIFVKHLSRTFVLKEIHSILIRRILVYLIWFVTALIAFNAIGLNTSSITLIAGALSVGIGFGLQSIASNILGGIILLFDRSIKLGDFVEIEGITGKVTQINLRKTIVKTNDNIDYIIPNSSFVNGNVINWTYSTDIRRFRIAFSVSYGINIDKLTLVIIPEIKKLKNIKIPPEPEIWLIGFGESSLDFEVVFWARGNATRQPLFTESEARKIIYNALNRAKITIPFPQRVVHLSKE